MEYENVINVRKRMSPLTYLGIILLVIALAFASMLAVLHFMKPAESYKTAEMNYFAAMSSAYLAEQDFSEAMEYELNVGLNTDSPLLGGYFSSLNNTVLKGFVGVDGNKIDYAVDYFNGNKKVLGAALWLNENIVSVACPGLSDIMLTFEIPDEYMSGDYTNLDYEALEITLTKITDKYFELVGEPEVINDNAAITEGGISAECKVYRIIIDELFMKELLKTSIDAILENDNLVTLLGDEFVEVLEDGLVELDSLVASDEHLIMDVYASDNVICKREIKAVSASDTVAEINITSLENNGKGYFSINATSEGEEFALINEYTKDGAKASGTLTLSTSTVIYNLISGDLFTLTYKDVVYDEKYGYVGEFKLSVPAAGMNIKGSSNIDDKYNFTCDVDVMGQQLCNLAGYFKYYDDYTDVGMPDKSQFEEHAISIDSSNPNISEEVLEKIEEDVMEFFGAGLYERLTDENGNLDIIGFAITTLFTSNISSDFYLADANDYISLY